MGNPRVHLIAPAGSCRDFFPKIGASGAAELIDHVQQIVGRSYQVTGDAAIIEAAEDHDHGGRRDDGKRALDIQHALADSSVIAIVMLRGGAWFTRILPRIDFSVLDRRETQVVLFGFSELTPMVNIVGAHRKARALYGMGPVFLGYGLKRHARLRLRDGGCCPSLESTDPIQWMRDELPERFRQFFGWVVSVLETRAEPITIQARSFRGRLPDEFPASFIGGNLTVLSTIIGSRYADAIDPAGRWILLEDYNDKPERFDRYLAHMTLAGFWNRCAGVLLGDFHQDDRDLTGAVIEMLEYHLPCGRLPPVMTTTEVGHTWPMKPVPLHLPARARRVSDGEFTFSWTMEDLFRLNSP